MRSLLAISGMLVVSFGAACKRTSNGDVIIDKPSSVHVTTQPETLKVPQISTPHIRIHESVDTVNTPTVSSKKTVVKHPSIDVTRH